MSEAQTVFLVDDDESYLSSVRRLLQASGYTVTCFTSAPDFLSQRPPRAAGCAVADLQMPGMDGIALQEELAKSENPIPVIFLTGHGDIHTTVKAMRRGAEDFLVKTASKKELLAAIERALARDGLERADRENRRRIRARFGKLTPRETVVLSHVLSGRLNKQIAAELGMSERSVKRHRTNLMRKLEVESVAELTRFAMEADVSDPTLPE